MARLCSRDAEATGRATATRQLKDAAQRLFAEKGTEGTTVREIAIAAGHKNLGVVGYYFGSKDALVREVTMDGAVALDQARNSALDAMEAQGGPKSAREIVDLLIGSVATLEDECYISFITLLGSTNRDLLFNVIDPAWNRAYGRCLEHLRTFMPHLKRVEQNHRFVFIGTFLNTIMSTRARALTSQGNGHPMWQENESLAHFAQIIVSILQSKLDLTIRSAPKKQSPSKRREQSSSALNNLTFTTCGIRNPLKDNGTLPSVETMRAVKSAAPPTISPPHRIACQPRTDAPLNRNSHTPSRRT